MGLACQDDVAHNHDALLEGVSHIGVFDPAKGRARKVTLDHQKQQQGRWAPCYIEDDIVQRLRPWSMLASPYVVSM
jgi:hypothetical protein